MKQSKGWEERFDEFDQNDDNHRRCYECEGSLMPEKLKKFISIELEKAKSEVVNQQIGVMLEHGKKMYKLGREEALNEISQKIEDIKKVLK